MQRKVGMIWAQGRNGSIGRNGVMPWHLPEDLAHFKDTTVGAPVIMGRKTWESLPEKFRPLPGRQNIVVTRNDDFVASGAVTAESLEEAFAKADPPSKESTVDAWVIGGGELYKLAMPLATKLVVTMVDLEVADADTFAPEIDDSWSISFRGSDELSRSGVTLRFEEYERQGGPISGSLEE